MKKESKFSRIIAGTMTWGQWGKGLSRLEMSRLIQDCLQIGITSFDHADIYGDYGNEEAFGAAFLETGIAREEIQLITKCGIQLNSSARSNKVKHYDYSKDYIVWSVERSLQCLKTDYVDLLLLHRPSPLMEPEEVLEAISYLLDKGKILDFGVSNFSPSQIAVLRPEIPVFGHQFEFSLTTTDPMYDGCLDDCISKGRMAMSWSPLGAYFKESSERIERIAKTMRPMIQKYEAAEDQLLLAWLLKHPAVVYPVVGTTNNARLSSSVVAANLNMELEDWFLLLEASLGREVP